MRPESLGFLKALVRAPSPSGYEQPVAQVYRDYTKRFVDDVRTDIHGNTVAIINPDAGIRVMLSAHMDEIGFVIHHIGEDGLLHFSPIGGHDDVVAVGQRVWVHGRERIGGVVGSRPFQLLHPGERANRPQMNRFWIDIGASSRQEAEGVVRLGDPVTFEQEFRPLMGDRAAARAFDNKAGLFVVAEALRSLAESGGLHPEVGVYGLGTVQEEIGSRGARTATYEIGPLTGLAIDMDHATDIPNLDPREHGQIALGSGPIISRGPNINHALFDLLVRAAEEEGISYQVRVFSQATPTDAGAMQVTRGGMVTGLLGIPLRYMHTPSETLSLTDLQEGARLAAAYCRRVTPDTDFTPSLGKG
ncbi:M20/M25/M40 family metallo-hydrolase [Enterovirga aerilata]|uniref:M20/M25/M40 family metallo-hydrolase n=1 Tax=Enterovirga aerilata TaxID=2730920 RepID=A0A849I6P3_9HYPH|nr:M20/M25/M40 family metallo-hydrolase [Enterovirga sp. DB1703]NNM71707.1 M20/M25/M40 family metallo-hydrolase [Enterovirga sp. DB1703]